MACREITWNQWSGWPFCNYVHPLHLFNEFCDVAKVAIICRKIWQNLASSIARFNKVTVKPKSSITRSKHTNRLYVSCINLLGGEGGWCTQKKNLALFFCLLARSHLDQLIIIIFWNIGPSPKQKYRGASLWPSFIGYESSTLGKEYGTMGDIGNIWGNTLGTCWEPLGTHQEHGGNTKIWKNWTLQPLKEKRWALFCVC